jgi:hypothetical protein
MTSHTAPSGATDKHDLPAWLREGSRLPQRSHKELKDRTQAFEQRLSYRSSIVLPKKEPNFWWRTMWLWVLAGASVILLLCGVV